MQTQFHPLDYETLKKGDYITPEQAQEITGKKMNDPKFPLALLNLKERIRREMQAQRRPITAKVEQLGIRILSDPEASNYNDKQASSALRKLGRSVKRLLQVDQRNLDDGETKVHERRIVTWSKTYQAAKASRRESLKLPVHERKTPGVIEQQKE
jgi:hypothetical protein